MSLSRILFAVLSFVALVFIVPDQRVAAADGADGHSGHANHTAMGMIDQSQEPWAQQLKGQTIIENAIEGRPERSAMVEMQHNRLMEQMAKQFVEPAMKL